MSTFPVAVSALNIIFPAESNTVNAPVLIQSALIPILFRIFVIMVPSTRRPAFHVLPPSVLTAHPFPLSSNTTLDSSMVE